MGFLSGDQIKDLHEELFEENYTPNSVKQVCYDLRLGDEVFLTDDPEPKKLSRESPYVTLPPGQFALLKTLEAVSVPAQYVGFISIRKTFKFRGLINISGFHVDPTYRGHLIFAVQNVGPRDILLEYEHPVFLIMWAKLEAEFTGPKRPPGYDGITLDEMAQFGGTSTTIASLRKDLDSLSLSVKIYGAIFVSALVALLIKGLF